MSNPLIEFASSVKSLLYIVFITVLGVAIYYCIFLGYPRIFTPGHTESGFDDFMEDYVNTIVRYANDTQNDNTSTIQAASQTFLSTYSDTFKYDLTTLAPITMDNAIHIFIVLMFYDDIAKGNQQPVGLAYNIMSNNSKVGKNGLQALKALYDPKSKVYQEFNSQSWENLQACHTAFEAFRSAVGGARSTATSSSTSIDGNTATIDLIYLDTYLNKYFDQGHDNVKRMYLMRQIGGFPNFTLFKLYMSDYIQYIFIEKIKDQLWAPFKTDFTSAIDKVNNFLTSDSVMNWFTNLPNMIANGGNKGSDNFVNYTEHFKGLIKNPYADDKQENFIQYLIQIAKTFVSLFQVVISIVNVISDPLAFIKYLFGIVIAIVLFITYVILIALQIGTAIAAIWVISVKIALTVVWVTLFLIFAIIYGVLTVLDMPLGGLIMRNLRCENLPDAWSRVSNWHKGNKFSRTFFCSRQCRDNFYPSDLSPLCVKQKLDEPALAPQQILYNVYKNKTFIDKMQSKFIYGRSPDMNYFVKMSEVEKKDMWSSVYDAQLQYSSDVETGYEDFDDLGKQICVNFYLNPLPTLTSQNKVITLCQTAYCDGGTTAFNFCANTESQVEADEPPPKDIVKMIVFALLVLTVLCIFIWFVARKKNSIEGFDVVATNSKPQPSQSMVQKFHGLMKMNPLSMMKGLGGSGVSGLLGAAKGLIPGASIASGLLGSAQGLIPGATGTPRTPPAPWPSILNKPSNHLVDILHG